MGRPSSVPLQKKQTRGLNTGTAAKPFIKTHPMLSFKGLPFQLIPTLNGHSLVIALGPNWIKPLLPQPPARLVVLAHSQPRKVKHETQDATDLCGTEETSVCSSPPKRTEG